MRKAIATILEGITGIEGVYQVFTVPKDAETPYITIKFTGMIPSVNNKKGRFRGLEIRVYDVKRDFDTLEGYIDEIWSALDDVLITTDSGHKFRCEHTETLEDYYDEDLDLISRQINFQIPS
jgi:hypothetical protein